MRNFKYFLEDLTKHKARVHQLDFIGALLQAKVKDSRYADYFPDYSKFFGRALRLFKSMYGMTKSEKVFSYELTQSLLEAFFI